MKETNTVRFFEGLAQRMYHENDLSDMVYALCLSNTQFKQFFLDFFFKDQGLKAENVLIEREVSYSDGSRPDFVIRDEDKIYFVEVKIWDRSHHFAQYSKTLEGIDNKTVPLRLGYITNYEISEDELDGDDKSVFNAIKESRVKQWSALINALESSPECSAWNNSEEVQGLIAYCKKVCPYDSDEKIDTYKYNYKDFELVKNFYEALLKFLTSESTSKIEIRNHIIQLDKHRVANTPAETIGFYFGAVDVTPEMAAEQKLFSGKKVWGWVGLRLKKKSLGLCIAFDNIKGWGKPVFDHLKNNSAWLPYCFAPPKAADECNQMFATAFSTVFEKLICRDQTPVDISHKMDVSEWPYYAIRRLPLFIRQKVFPELKIEGCRISPFSQKDAFNPSGWCGEYFSVIRNPQYDGGEGKEVGCFWIGTYYDDRKDNNRIVCEQLGGEIRTVELDKEGWLGEINSFIKGCV